MSDDTGNCSNRRECDAKTSSGRSRQRPVDTQTTLTEASPMPRGRSAAVRVQSEFSLRQLGRI
jgi:hypothetical protein